MFDSTGWSHEYCAQVVGRVGTSVEAPAMAQLLIGTPSVLAVWRCRVCNRLARRGQWLDCQQRLKADIGT